MSEPIVKIYKQTRNLMQSGSSGLSLWVVEFYPSKVCNLSELANWVSSCDPNMQVQLKFKDLESAVVFAKKRKLPYRIMDSIAEAIKTPKSYADIFKSRIPF